MATGFRDEHGHALDVVEVEADVLRESDRAWLLSDDNGTEGWVPKSLADRHGSHFMMPKWLAEERGFL